MFFLGFSGRQWATNVEHLEPPRSGLGLRLDDTELFELSHGAQHGPPRRRVVELGECAETPQRMFPSVRVRCASESIAIVTPAGTGMGCLPIRDMAHQTVATTSPPTP